MKPEQLWQRLVDEAGEAEIDLAVSVSVADAEKELRDLGFDVAAEREQAESFLLSLEANAAPARAPAQVKALAQTTDRRRRVTAVVWLAAAATAAVGGAAAYSALHKDVAPSPPAPSSPPTPSTPAPPAPTVSEPPPPELVATSTPAELRAKAATALQAGDPRACLTLLDRAAAQDPAGDKTPAVSQLRQKAMRALDPKPGR